MPLCRLLPLWGPLVAAVLTGAFVVENIFSIPGMGKYFVQSVQANNYSVIAGTTIFYGTFLILANLVVDLIYGLIRPKSKTDWWKGVEKCSVRKQRKVQ